MVPRTFETWVSAMSLVFLVIMVGSWSVLRVPLSLIGSILREAFLRVQSCCQGTMLEWCSISVMMMLSPGLRLVSAYECAIRLIDAVVPGVKMISSGCDALMNCWTFVRTDS